jgi:hypothetical protein
MLPTVQAITVAIDRYAEKALGNRDYFLNKPYGVGQGRMPLGDARDARMVLPLCPGMMIRRSKGRILRGRFWRILAPSPAPEPFLIVNAAAELVDLRRDRDDCASYHRQRCDDRGRSQQGDGFEGAKATASGLYIELCVRFRN